MCTKLRRMSMGLTATTAVLVMALGAAPAEAKPGDGKGGDPPARSEQADKGSGKPDSDLSQPQPPSNADYSGHGANTHGPYDSTRDGSPSANGNGDGKATGKPCAGCVGKADNKNPRGQLPGGSDPNSGYECDSNKGVGRGNPAHTACVEGAPPEVPPKVNPPKKNPPKMDRPPRDLPPGQLPPESARPGGNPAAPEALALTGMDVDGPLTAGIALLVAGGALLSLGQRRGREKPRQDRLADVYALSSPRDPEGR